MNIFCDIGNTKTKIIILNKQPKFTIIPTNKFLKFYSTNKNAYFYVSCVVNEIEELLFNQNNVKMITYRDLRKYIKIKYDTKNLGTDRILSVFSSKQLFDKNFVVISLGSAIVIDYVDKNGCFVGGEIFLGLNNLARYLHTSASKLPLVKFQKKICFENLIGNNTVDCICKGIFNFCTSGIINFLNKVKPANVIFTGGEANIFLNSFDFNNLHIKVHKIDNLVLLGIILWAYLLNIVDKKKLICILKSKIFGDNIDFKKIIL